MDRVLYVASNNPWGIGGGSVASYAYLTAFLEVFKNAEIDLCICQEHYKYIPEEWIRRHKNVSIVCVPPRCTLARVLTVFNGQIHRFQSNVQNLIEANQYEYCVFDRSDTASTNITSLSSRTKKIVVHHNFEPQYYADNSGWLARVLFLHHVRNGERQAYLNADCNIFLTLEDEAQFRENYGENDGKNLCLGLFSVSQKETVITDDLKSKLNKIVITGSLNNTQNIDGIRYFVNELYPLINQSFEFIVAGQKPTEEIVSILSGKSNIKLIADPTDMNGIVSQCAIYLCTTRLGSGIKVRIMDGLQHGLPVIAHDVSARGYHSFIDDGVFYSFSNPVEFASKFDEVIKKINDGIITSHIVANSYKKNLTLDSVVKKISEVIKQRSIKVKL